MRALVRHPGVVIGLALLAVAAGIAVVRARGSSVPTTLVTRSDLEQHVVASGRVWVPTRVSIAAQVPGLVVAVGAIEGQRVRSGDLLLQIDDAEARSAVEQARAAVQQAAARVAQLRKVGAIVATETSRQADTNLERAQTELARTEKLVAAGSVAGAQLEEARRAVEIARAQKSAAEAQQLAAAPLGADSRLALSTLLQSQAQLTGAQVRLEQTRILARQDGVILSRSVEPGDVVQPAQTLLVMAADAEPQLVITPDERNLAWIALGQPARASADAYPQQVFDAVVSYIAPSIDPQRGSVEVRLRVQDAPDVLKPDMTVSVDLTVARKSRTLSLPSEALRGAATATPWVWALHDGRVVRREVTLGIRGRDRVEILSGLSEGAEVVFGERQALAPGQRVRPERGAR